MRLKVRRVLVTAFVSLSLAGASACSEAAPDASASPDTFTSPASSAAAGNVKQACEAVMNARKKALDALAPVSTALAQVQPSADDIAKAINDLRTVFIAMHLQVAAAAEQAGDTQLKATIVAYQTSVELVIVAVEGADRDKTKLAAAIDLPELRSAEKAVVAACA